MRGVGGGEEEVRYGRREVWKEEGRERGCR